MQLVQGPDPLLDSLLAMCYVTCLHECSSQLMVSFVVMQVGLSPFRHHVLNKMETVSLCATCLTMYLACFFTVQASFNRNFLASIGITLIVLNSAVMAWFLFTMLRSGTMTVLKQIGAMAEHEDQVHFPSQAVAIDVQAACMDVELSGQMRAVISELLHLISSGESW